MSVDGKWCILRTSPSRTLLLAKSLAGAGLDVWTPVQLQRRRLPRGSKVHIERDAPIMPTFVFAAASDLPAVADILRLPMNPHPGFSIFRYHGAIPLIDEREIAYLREVEAKAKLVKLRQQRHVFPIGTVVQVPGGSFTGLSGVVKGGDGKHALVCFGGRFEMQIATFLLRVEDVDQTSPTTISGSAAARAA